MADRDLAGRTRETVAEDRDEGTAFAALLHRLDHMPTVGTEHAAVIVHVDAGRRLRGLVDDLRRDLAQEPIDFLVKSQYNIDVLIGLLHFINDQIDT